MGRFSIRLKITIWFTAALVVIVLFAYLMIFVVSRQILIKTIQDSLVETVENNVDEIEYFSGMDEIRTDADIDYLIDYRKGYLLLSCHQNNDPHCNHPQSVFEQ